MTERQSQELALLRTRYPDLEVAEEGMWVLIGVYPVPGDAWTRKVTPVAFQIPPAAAQEPYGFYVPKELQLRAGGPIDNYTDGATPFPGAWAKFSWAIAWRPADELTLGTTMLDFATSFGRRLAQGA